MSILLAKRDRLRERAEEMRFLAPDPNVPYLVPSTKETMALAMRSAANEMEDAADTIWQLRNTNLDTRSENDDLKAENAELRKLVQDMYKAFFTLDIDQCQACPREDDCVYMYRVSDCMQCAFERDMRWLGIEVGE